MYSKIHKYNLLGLHNHVGKDSMSVPSDSPRKHNLTANSLILWLLQCFCSFFFNVPWPFFFLSKNLKCVEFLNLGKEWLCTLEVYTILWNINPLLLNIPMTTIACMFCSHRHFLCGILDWHLLTLVFTSLVIRLETRDAHLSVAASWTLTTGRDVNPWLWGND